MMARHYLQAHIAFNVLSYQLMAATVVVEYDFNNNPFCECALRYRTLLQTSGRVPSNQEFPGVLTLMVCNPYPEVGVQSLKINSDDPFFPCHECWLAVSQCGELPLPLLGGVVKSVVLFSVGVIASVLFQKALRTHPSGS